MNIEIKRQIKRLAWLKSLEENHRLARAAHEEHALVKNEQLAAEFIDWARRARIKSVKLPSTPFWKNRQRLDGWVIELSGVGGKDHFMIAITVTKQIFQSSIVDYFDVYYLVSIEQKVARYVAIHAPDVPWK